MSTAEEHRQIGNEYFKSQDYKNAIASYTTAVNLDPSNGVIYRNRCLAHIRSFQWDQALADLQQALAADLKDDKTYSLLLQVCVALGRPVEAENAFASIQAPSAQNRDLLIKAQNMKRNVLSAGRIVQSKSAADYKMAAHLLDDAERSLGTGVAVPRDWLLTRARLALAQGNTASATSICMSLLRKSEIDTEAITIRGTILYGEGDTAKALAHFQQALRVDPDNAEARTMMRSTKEIDGLRTQGNESFKGGKHEAAIEFYTQAINAARAAPCQSNNLVSKLYSNRASSNVKLGKHQEALADCNSSLELDSEFVKVMKTKARVLGQLEEWEESVRTFQAAIEIDGADQTLRQELRTAEVELKKSKRVDPYKVLQVSRTATDVEIKKAYRKLALVHHPDKNVGDDKAAEMFKKIGKAYEMLSDPQQKAAYDAGVDPDDPYASQGGFGGGGYSGGFPGGFGGYEQMGGHSFQFGGGGGGFHQGGFGGGGLSPEDIYSMFGQR